MGIVRLRSGLRRGRQGHLEGAVKRIAIDSMIVDTMLDTSDLFPLVQDAADKNALIIVSNHIVRDQLAATPDPARRSRLLAAYQSLPKTEIATRGFVLGVSRLDEGRFGDGSESGVSLDQVRTKGRGAIHDALITTTASGDADVLVTEDGTLIDRAKAAGVRCEIWRFNEFVAFVRKAACP